MADYTLAPIQSAMRGAGQRAPFQGSS